MLRKIQQELKVPKGQLNKFGNYRYRSCEDILEAVKPLLGDAILTISDEIVEVGGRLYVKATATYKNGEEKEIVTAYAREEDVKKGMDGAQITGAASSYARKYALNGLFLIDDTKDADTQDNTENLKHKIDQCKTLEELQKLGEKLKDPESIAYAREKYRKLQNLQLPTAE